MDDRTDLEAQRYRQLIELADPGAERSETGAGARPRTGLILVNLLRWADEERGRVESEIEQDERRWRRAPETRPLGSTRLDVRTIELLEHHAIWTLGDLAALSGDDLLGLPNFGATTLTLVQDVLREFELELATSYS